RAVVQDADRLGTLEEFRAFDRRRWTSPLGEGPTAARTIQRRMIQDGEGVGRGCHGNPLSVRFSNDNDSQLKVNRGDEFSQPSPRAIAARGRGWRRSSQ